MRLSKKQILCVGIAIALGYGVYRKLNRYIYVPDLYNFVAHKNLRILVTSNARAFGEMASVHRISNALSSMGYGTLAVFSSQIPVWTRWMNFDFAIVLRPEIRNEPKFFNFMVLHYADHPVKYQYDAILSVVPEDIVRKTKKAAQNIPICPFYLTVHKTNFFDAPKKKLFFCGDPWDAFRREHCVKTYKLLDQTGYLEVYGHPEFWEKQNLKSYHGVISNKNDALLHTMQKAGVALVLHSDGHFKNNTTTARIFEALAASNVVICDRLPFITENFGDTVLYVDRDISPEELFRQIDAHMQWILSHQEEAIEMARKSHKIFVEKFSLEMIMRNVLDFYFQQKLEQW